MPPPFTTRSDAPGDRRRRTGGSMPLGERIGTSSKTFRHTNVSRQCSMPGPSPWCSPGCLAAPGQSAHPPAVVVPRRPPARLPTASLPRTPSDTCSSICPGSPTVTTPLGRRLLAVPRLVRRNPTSRPTLNGAGGGSNPQPGSSELCMVGTSPVGAGSSGGDQDSDAVSARRCGSR